MGRLRRGLREVWVVLRSVWWNLALFVGVVVGAALLLQVCGCYPGASFHQRLVNALYMARLESVPGSGHHALPSVLVVVMPVLTILILGEGALRIAAAYLGRKHHRDDWEKLMVSTLSGHTVLCGAGELGRTLLLELMRRNPEMQVVVVDTHTDILSELGMHASNLHHICGDMTGKDTLEMANVQAAATILITSGDDGQNLETATKVVRLNPKAQVWVRLYRSGLLEIMDTTARPNVHFFSPYQAAAEDLADQLGRKT
jgi:hypothetical protein